MPCPKLVDIAAHALALHHDVFGGQRVGQGVFVLHRQHHVGHRFESVGLVEVEHDGVFIGSSGGEKQPAR